MSFSCPASAVGNFSCLPAREAYPSREKVSFRVLCIRRDKKVSCSEESAGNSVIGVLPGKPVVNTKYTSFASIYCHCSCIQPFLLMCLYETFKSYKMLSVLIISITVLKKGREIL
jgi:hypothetical protein